MNTLSLGWNAGGFMSIDSKDDVHICYTYDAYDDDTYTNASNQLAYTYIIDGHFLNETIEKGDYHRFRYSVLDTAVDSSYAPHVFYTETIFNEGPLKNFEQVKYASKLSGSWNNQTFLEDVKIGDFKMVIDSQDRIHVVYIDALWNDTWNDYSYNLVYTTNSGGDWSFQTIEQNISGGVSFVVDSEDNLHLIYTDINGALKYRIKSNNSWQIQTITNDVNLHYSLALDSQNHAHIVYPDSEGLVYASNVDNSWQIEHIPYNFDYYKGASGTRNLDLVLDSQSYAHIVFVYDDMNSHSNVTYVTNMEGSWSIQSLNYLIWEEENDDSWGQTGFLGVDSLDRIHLVYESQLIFSPIYAIFSPTIISVPEPPLNVTATPGNSQVQLSWVAPNDDGGSPITGYNLLWGLSTDGPYSSISVNGTSYLHEGLENGRTYYYKVSAINAAGEGDKTEVVSATPLAELVLPSAPTNLVASEVNGNVSLSWTATSDEDQNITGYKVYRGASPSTIELLTSTTNTTFLDISVFSNQTYYYQVSAFNEYGESNRSNTVNVTISSPNGAEPAPSFFETIEGQVAIAGMVIAGVGALAYAVWRGRRP